jgi:hypothetical protein
LGIFGGRFYLEYERVKKSVVGWKPVAWNSVKPPGEYQDELKLCESFARTVEEDKNKSRQYFQ